MRTASRLDGLGLSPIRAMQVGAPPDAIPLGLEAALPAGAFYYWLPLPARARSGAGTDAMAFCLRVGDEGKVIVVPGAAFGAGGGDFVRLSYAARPDEIREGIARLAPFWRES